MHVPNLADIQATPQVAFELFAMHYVEVRRAYDFKNPGSQDQDPIFKNYSLPKHEVGYPGGIFAPFVPGVAFILRCAAGCVIVQIHIWSICSHNARY